MHIFYSDYLNVLSLKKEKILNKNSLFFENCLNHKRRKTFSNRTVGDGGNLSF